MARTKLKANTTPLHNRDPFQLEKLPLELFNMVCEELDFEGLLVLRFVSKTIQQWSHPFLRTAIRQFEEAKTAVRGLEEDSRSLAHEEITAFRNEIQLGRSSLGRSMALYERECVRKLDSLLCVKCCKLKDEFGFTEYQFSPKRKNRICWECGDYREGIINVAGKKWHKGCRDCGQLIGVNAGYYKSPSASRKDCRKMHHECMKEWIIFTEYKDTLEYGQFMYIPGPSETTTV